MMVLEEAIKHCEEVAKEKCDACGAEHKQLAEWLRELKWRRKAMKWMARKKGELMMEKIELKPCPFCGGEAEVALFMGNYLVVCKCCPGSIFPAKA